MFGPKVAFQLVLGSILLIVWIIWNRSNDTSIVGNNSNDNNTSSNNIDDNTTSISSDSNESVTTKKLVDPNTGGGNNNNLNQNFQLQSDEFKNQTAIPTKFCTTISPPLRWSHSIPFNTKSFVLIVDDPDAIDDVDHTPWVHWILYNIPMNCTSLPEGFSSEINNNKNQNSIFQQLHNDWYRLRYDGPSPPSGTHHYSFRLYALRIELITDMDLERTRQTIQKIQNKKNNKNYGKEHEIKDVIVLQTFIREYIIDSTVLIGTYNKKQNQ